MADIIREKIIKNIETVLKSIITANGYANTIASVQRFKQDGNSLVDVPLVLITEGTESGEDGPHPLITKRLDVYLSIIARQDTASDTRSSDELMNSLRGDVEKALMADYSRGGNAEDTKYISASPIDVIEGQPEIGAVMQFEIHYRHQRTNPGIIA